MIYILLLGLAIQQLQFICNNANNIKYFDRSALIGGTTGFGDDPWSSEPPEGASGYSVDDIRQQQRQVIQGKCSFYKGNATMVNVNFTREIAVSRGIFNIAVSAIAEKFHHCHRHK